METLLNRIWRLSLCFVLFISCVYVCMAFFAIPLHAREASQSKLYFRFGEAVVKSWFRDNAGTLSHIDSMFSSADLQGVSKIEIVGSSSPEGEEAFNRLLSRERAEALLKYISDKFNLSDTLFSLEYLETNNRTENFRDLRYVGLSIIKKEMLVRNDTVMPAIQANANISDAISVRNDGIMNCLLKYWWLLCGALFVLICILLSCKIKPVIERLSIPLFRKRPNRQKHVNRTPRKCGTLNGDHSCLKIDISFIPKTSGSNCENRTFGEILKHAIVGNGDDLNEPIFRDLLEKVNDVQDMEIKYKNGYPDFSPWTLAKVSAKDATDSRYGQEGNMSLFDRRLAEKLGNDFTANKVRLFINNNYLVWHENPDGTADLVPQNIHINIPHDGLVSKIKNKK